MLYHHPRPSAVDPSDRHLPDNAITGPGRMADIFLDAARGAAALGPEPSGGSGSSTAPIGLSVMS
jgi:hypothetical protein